ncbi:double-strand break repair protein AddB [Maricaulis sp.]|uniref:double-strand break repair protein AddB n=1 Tax=Maricaulis sp. TaxID=1486257 RepID=UPI00260FCFDC|nr:double-strand break repair protein AddB [Maricaulis sp.]
MTAALFDTPAPRIFTLAPEADHLAAIAAQLAAAYPGDALTRLLILTPTRRAAKALGDAFADLSGSGVALLPRIKPLGDIDVDDPPFEPGELAGLAPPAIPGAKRKFELARLVLAKEKALGRPIGLAGALVLAEPLAQLLDDLANEDVEDLSALDAEVLEHLPEDRREAFEFLSILNQAWPQRLSELGMMDAAARRAMVLHALADRWQDQPPDHPVLVVGSTGSIPAVRRLMRIVAGLREGAVVLPGFDWDADEAVWAGIDEAHPQWAMRAFITEAGTTPSGVRQWPGAAESEPARARRLLIAEALRPASATDGWLGRIGLLREQYGENFFHQALDALNLIEAPDPLAEARICALLLRETLEDPAARAILVTPDRALAQRVAAEMTRFGVRLDDSGGLPLAQCASGAFLDRLLAVAEDPGSVVRQSALWASPLFAAGRARGDTHTVMAKFEAAALRGARPGSDVASLRRRLDKFGDRLFPDDRHAAGDILDTLDAAIARLQATGNAPKADPERTETRTMADWARSHAEAAEALARDGETHGALRLWRGEGGESAALLMRELIHESDALPAMTLGEYAAAFRELLRGRRIPPSLGVHPRLQILGPLEARLIRADRIILGGLNEGVWPQGPSADPWMSRRMRESAGLGAPERRYGLAAHDFSQIAAAGGEVFLTRSARADGAPTVASRWLWRLQTLARGALAEEADSALRPEVDYLALARALDRPAHAPKPAAPPQPRPPVSARPRKMSITEIRTWVRDPYSIYARHLLGLRPLDPADMVPGPRERGTALHDALQACVERWVDEVPANAVEELCQEARLALVEAGFAPEALSLEMPRFERAARWFADWEIQRRKTGRKPAALEIKGVMTLEGPAGDWQLSGRADRFDRTPDGHLETLDYKTGTAPSAKMVKVGFEPQLPLTAAMAQQAGVFDRLEPGAPSALLYLTVSGNKEAGRETRIDKADPAEELALDALENLRKLIARFDDENEAYPSQPRAQYKDDYGDFDHLARRGEWAVAANGEEGAE